MDVKITLANKSHLSEILNLFNQTVRAVCNKDYSDLQINTWALSIENQNLWIEKITKQYFIIAWLENEIIGFASLDLLNTLDMMYVHKDFQNNGIASKLLKKIEHEAIQRDAKIIRSEVSITARAFFERKGFKTITQQLVFRNGIGFINFEMIKQVGE